MTRPAVDRGPRVLVDAARRVQALPTARRRYRTTADAGGGSPSSPRAMLLMPALGPRAGRPRRSCHVPTYPLFQHAYLVDRSRCVDPKMERSCSVPARSRSVGTTSRPGSPIAGRRPQADVSYAFGYLGDVQVQLIQQHDDNTLDLPRHVRPRRGGLPPRRHPGARLRRRRASTSWTTGFELACELWTGGVDAAYFDTRSATGCFTEIHGDPPYILDTFARWRAAHASHSPDADPVLDPSIGASGTPG